MHLLVCHGCTDYTSLFVVPPCSKATIVERIPQFLEAVERWPVKVC